MSELTQAQFNRSVLVIRFDLRRAMALRGRGERRLLAFAIYGAMGGDAESASYQKVYAAMRSAGLAWNAKRHEWQYISAIHFLEHVEPLYRPFWVSQATALLFNHMLYINLKSDAEEVLPF